MTEARTPDDGTERHDGSGRRSIRSFVLRQGRVSNAQLRALEQELPRYGIAYAPHPLDLDAVFGRSGPKVLEIGSGMGETTARIAGAMPATDFIAVEVHTPGVGSLLKLIAEAGLANLRIIQHDAVDVVGHMLTPASLHGIHVFFPDPWPKKRHHKRRLIQAPFVALLASRLVRGGYLHVATDWEAYAEQVLAVLSAEPLLENTAEDYAPRPDWRPQTRFETRGVRLGHRVRDIVFRRVS